MKTQEKKQKTLKMVELAILLALVVVLQSISSFGVVTICLCLVPITLGAMVLGPKGGAALGFAFGIIAAFWGIVGKDGFTFLLFSANPVMTIIICLVKGTMAGLVSALLYKWISKGNFKGSKLVASIVAGIAAPVVNTGFFVIGCLIIKEDVVSVCSSLGLDTSNYIALLFLSLIGVNFFVELLVNVIFAPALNKVTGVIEKLTTKNKPTQKKETIPAQDSYENVQLVDENTTETEDNALAKDTEE